MLPYCLHLPLLIGLGFLLYRKSAGALLRPFFGYALAAKLAAGIAVGLVYTYYYDGGDTFVFFQDAGHLADLASRSPVDFGRVLLFDQYPDETLPSLLVYEQEPRSFFLIKILSVVSLATLGSYWLSGVYFSLFSFWGMWRLANTLANVFPGTQLAAALAFLFFPSVVFWSAGVMKESLAVGIIGLVTARWLSALLRPEPWKTSRSFGPLLFYPLLLLVLWKLKYYYFAVYLPCLLAGGLLLRLHRRSRSRSPWAWIGLFLLLLAGTTGLVTRLHPNLAWHYFLEVLVQTHDTLYALSKAGNRIEYDQLQPTIASFLRNLPLALTTGLFRPFWWECHQTMQGMNGLENLFLLLLAGNSLFRIWQKKGLRLSREAWMLLGTTGVYILILAALLAFSTPNFGTLTRYKVAFLPFLVYLLATGAGLQTAPSDRDTVRRPPARFSTGGRKS